jgi:hypothetical protein
VWYSQGYSFEQRSLDDQQLHRFEVYDVPFLPLPKYVTMQGARGPYKLPVGGGDVFLGGVDSLGQLWVVGRPPVENATPRAKPSARGTEGLLEIFDPRSGQVKSSQTIPTPIVLMPKGNLAYSAIIDADRVVVGYDVFSFRFVGW